MPFAENRREKVLVLLAMCFALFMAMLDNTVVNVALPTISRELGAGVSGLQWIVDAYVLAFASLILTGGIIGERLGRKRVFLGGLALFTLASLACALSQSTGQLIAFRAVQGVAGALLIPGTLSILTVTFPPSERAQAIGIWAGVSGIALALGPTLGGWLVENAGWESVFFLNIPIGVVGLFVAWRVVQESVSPVARSLDPLGLGLGTGALFTATYALIEANQEGWTDPKILTTLGLAVVLLVSFLYWQRRNPNAMMPLEYFRIKPFSAGTAVAFAVSFGMFGTFFFFSLYMQIVRGYSAFEAGVRFLPMTGMMFFAAPNAGRLAQKYGSRWPMTIGMLMSGTGLILLTQVDAHTPFWEFAPVLSLMGIGMGSTMTPMTAAVMNAVGPERAGLGSAMTNTAREVGGVFGIALLGTLLTTRLQAVLPGLLRGVGLAAPAEAAIVAGAGHGRLDPSMLQGLPAAQAAGVQGAFQDAFLSGFHLALLVAGCVLYAAAIAANRFVPSGAPHRVQVGGSREVVAPAPSANGHAEVAATELRTKTSEYLRRASDGESFVVTSRGVPVASLGPPPDDAPR